MKNTQNYREIEKEQILNNNILYVFIIKKYFGKFIILFLNCI